jgi:hypothetical protein
MSSKNKKRRQLKEKQFTELLEPQRTDYYFSCFSLDNKLQRMKLPEYMVEHFQKLKLMVVHKVNLCRRGVFVWQEKLLTFTQDLLNKCSAYQNQDTQEVFFRLFPHHQTAILPNHVASRLQGCIQMIMRKCV